MFIKKVLTKVAETSNDPQQKAAKLSIGGGTFKFVIEDGWLRSKGVYSRFDVRMVDIETVTVSAVDRGKSALKIIGKGTTLAEAIAPRSIAEKAHRFILENL